MSSKAHFDILPVAFRFSTNEPQGVLDEDCDRKDLEVVLELPRDNEEGQH